MRLADYAERLIGLARAVYAWAGEAAAADRGRREQAALYAEEVAATLARAAMALSEPQMTARRCWRRRANWAAFPATWKL